MKLSKFTIDKINNSAVEVPAKTVFDLPEKVLQFGTGVLLRGLPDYFIDKANRQGVFNGRVVVVKSTTHGDISAFEKQDGLYTVCVRGIENGEKIDRNIINASISRVIDAHKEWNDVLKCAHNAHMQVVISNTTEVGIQLTNDDIRHLPPTSFPGKLLAFLYERYKAFDGDENAGMVIIPTELITDNGKKLESIVLELAHLNNLEDGFIQWLEAANTFCNSLVDRIVPGKPDDKALAALRELLGYDDELMIMSESYRLWAIEGDQHVREVLSFAHADDGVVIAEDIESFRELKLRLLNGTHTLSCAVAFLAGCETVKIAMEDESVSTFISELMMNELAPSIPVQMDINVAREFGGKVLDRFRNPEIKHQWISISMQYSLKMKSRCIPVLLTHFKKFGTVPELFTTGFAAFLAFMRPVEKAGDKFFGQINDRRYQLQDDMAGLFYDRWQTHGDDVEGLVTSILKDPALWGEDLSALPGFKAAVIEKLNAILKSGIRELIDGVTSKSESVA
jgi:tagaturonate reductase